MNPNPILQTPRLVLRKFALTDAEDVYAYACDPEVARYTSWNAHASLEESRAYIRFELARYAAGEPASWALMHRETGRVIGSGGFVKVAEAHRKAEIGYVIGREHWGQGLMSEAVNAMLAFTFGTLGLYRVEAFCKVENAASARVMEKVGMRFEGVLRAYVWKNGEPRDVKMYAVLAGERPTAP